MNRTVKRAAVLAAACSLGLLGVSSASADVTPPTGQNVYGVPNLNYCHGWLNTNWSPVREAQAVVGADTPTGVAVTCTAQLYDFQAGPTGQTYTVTNGGYAAGGWVNDNTGGDYKYVCVSEMDVYLATHAVSGNYAGCSSMY
ncbi:hypothetical protein [Kitasatospora cathayae]|uniref:Secreted protein n=1 Tax=Kitasatospora cathayae TaxID=3004092 RepID=A0ABY7QFV9_9ACTN|nr:hypothetical protein [Kitasatospora sp. HUAS 3-15]WBP91362.1 hypothetical protein O1G21_39460 [Kitasatospora sp. HUAS 3-15]WBP92052.1 hypothetical protein O1G21_40415 [Kitasatospora sp. HUAS 3-15]